MDDAFDPYYTWLGIPPHQQPADHYRLLGIPQFEENTEVIEHAADRQMTHLRSMQIGKHADCSQKLLGELSAARVCLLNPEKKAAYDAALHQKAAAAPAKGAAFDEYLLLDQISSSRTGQVFRAKHRLMDRIVALKILSREAVASEELVERFRRKVKILAQLSHPNLVSAYDAGCREGTHFLVMEYVDGQDLRAMLKQLGPPPVEAAVNYIIQAAAGLGFAHANGVYHRNVKPSNLMVDRSGVVKVIGLGLAHIDPGSLLGDDGGTQLTRPGEVMGSYEFMAPEQAADSSSVDARADVYSLGCALHALLTGRPPFPSPSPVQQVMSHRSHPVPSLRTVRRDVPEALDAVFQKMLAKQPDQRYQSMAEVSAALQACIAGPPAEAQPVPAPVAADQDVGFFPAPADQPAVGDVSPVETLPTTIGLGRRALATGRRAGRSKKTVGNLLRNKFVLAYLAASVVLIVVCLWLLLSAPSASPPATGGKSPAARPKPASKPSPQAETGPPESGWPVGNSQRE